MIRPERPIGGEMPGPMKTQIHSCLTDSGRSSLRLIVRSGFAKHKVLLPDYLCQIVADVLDQEGVEYAFYRIKEDLSIDAASVLGQTFDVLYVIDYFGHRTDYAGLVNTGTWILQDCVFSPFVRSAPQGTPWIGFNSLRKISPLADGSIVKACIALRHDLIAATQAPFVELKTRAKHKKWAFLHDGDYSEAEYLAEFERGEALIDAQRDVHAISDRSLHQLLDYYADLDAEREARQNNYAVLNERLSAFNLPLDTAFPSLYVLSVERRDELRDYLRTKAIYLPAHWPNPRGLDNPLYRSVVSVPVDGRYDAADMARIADLIAAFLANG